MPTFMKWLFRCRMGSPNVFEDRRAEIAQRRRCDTGAVTDEEVIEHFMASAAAEGGMVYRYLQQGQMAALIGRSLFVHGGVTWQNVGYCPYPFSAAAAYSATALLPGTMHASAPEWVAALNRLTREGFEEWVAHPHRAPDGSRTGGEYLRSFAYRYTPVLYSVMVNSPINPTTLCPIDREAGQYLFDNGIDTVCCGHQPTGDSPTLVATEQGGFVIVADNSYCAADNSRGQAVAEVLLEQDARRPDRRVQVHIRGSHADGRPFEYSVPPKGDRIAPLLGRPLPDGWWTKMPSADRTHIVCHKTTNRFFSIQYKELPVEAVEQYLRHREGGPNG
ncbi:hypothetical protein STCU_02619 [Strigomonas culicis]|nr:hypothetical protein STCU_02619 [Strigomonas culicis]|eukprot:EPY32834.1 hypothetical protein STCU_02619 [Strigomonas culicis]